MSKSTIAFSYTCSSCKKVHSGSPSFGADAPAYFDMYNGKNVQLNPDFCVIEDDYFVRATLEIPIIGVKEPFIWGVWVTQSEENFKFYKEHVKSLIEGRKTFGWFSTKLPYYSNTLDLKCYVHFHNHRRPTIELEKTEHQLSKDYQNGISIEQAIKIATLTLHGMTASQPST